MLVMSGPQEYDRRMHCHKRKPAVCITLCLIFCLEKWPSCHVLPFILCFSWFRHSVTLSLYVQTFHCASVEDKGRRCWGPERKFGYEVAWVWKGVQIQPLCLCYLLAEGSLQSFIQSNQMPILPLWSLQVLQVPSESFLPHSAPTWILLVIRVLLPP